MSELVVASGNRHKVAELAALLATHASGVGVVGPGEWGEPPIIAETGDTFVANAELKARGIAAWMHSRGALSDTIVLADDSGISVDALGGAPGVISAVWAGDPCDDAANNRKLVAELRARGLDRSPAHYTCVLALVRVDGGALDGARDIVFFDGRWDVEVRTEARGTGGFGYDPHAWIDGGARTVAELDGDAKAALSHRGRALRALATWWRTHA
jgi:XTP/dITP diphosphohydrolase